MCESLGEFVKRKRNEEGYTAGELATRTKLSEGYIRKIEAGQIGNPSGKVIWKLAVALDEEPGSFGKYILGPEFFELKEEIEHLEKKVNAEQLEFFDDLDSNTASIEALKTYRNLLRVLAKGNGQEP